MFQDKEQEEEAVGGVLGRLCKHGICKQQPMSTQHFKNNRINICRVSNLRSIFGVHYEKESR